MQRVARVRRWQLIFVWLFLFCLNTMHWSLANVKRLPLERNNGAIFVVGAKVHRAGSYWWAQWERHWRITTVEEVVAWPLNKQQFHYQLHDAAIDYRQHCAQRKAPVYNLLRGRFWGFSPRRGDTLHRWGWKLTCPLLHAKCHPITATIRVYRTPKLKFLLRFYQNSEYKRTAGAYSLRDFHEIHVR